MENNFYFMLKHFLKKSIFNSIPLAVILVLMVGCKKENTTDYSNPGTSSVIEKDSAILSETPKKTIKYTAFIFPEKKKDSAMKVFKEKFSQEQRYIILALNRLDQKNQWRADTLAIPDSFDDSLMEYSPFPSHLQSLEKVHKIAFFSYPIQAYALYNQGKLVKWGPTSLGKKSAQTKRGLMFTNWKKKLAISTVKSEWKLPYNFNIHNTLGIGWHEYDLPGYPASHSCLRLLEADAKFMYDWADQWVLTKDGTKQLAKGTPVIVFGDYNWGGKKPWKMLIDNPEADQISVAELEKLIQENLSEILQEQQNSDQFRAQVARSSEDSKVPST